MSIYLTSYGLDTRYKDYMNSYNDIIDILKDKRVAIIPNAKLKSEDRTNSLIARKELNKNNIYAEIIDIDINHFKIEKYDALYLSGGEPKYLMDSIISAGLLQSIKEFIDNDGTIIGQSAGAMIFCKKYLDTSSGRLLTQSNGLDYSSKMIVPHYNNLPKSILNQIAEDILKVNDYDKLIKLF